MPVAATLNGVDKLLLAKPISGTDWYLVVALDKDEAYAGMRSLLPTSAISLVVLVVESTAAAGALKFQTNELADSAGHFRL